MTFDARSLALAAVLAALYAALVVVQGLSAAATVQLRLADCLIPLSALFGWPAVFGVTLGAFVGNTYTSATLSNGVYDVVLGPLANLVAATLIYLLRRRKLAGCIVGSAIVGLVVGSYVWMIFGRPTDIFGLGLPIDWPIWVVGIISITISSLAAIAIIGYSLLMALSKSSIAAPVGTDKSDAVK